MFAGFVIFSVIGYMSVIQDKPVDEVAAAGESVRPRRSRSGLRSGGGSESSLAHPADRFFLGGGSFGGGDLTHPHLQLFLWI